MLQTRTASEYHHGVAAGVPAIVGVDRTVDEAGAREARLAAERALDEVLADSFPASDPPSWNPGIIRPQPADGFATAIRTVEGVRERLPVAEGVDVSGPTHGERTFLQSLVSLGGAVVIALLFGIGILLAGLPIVLVVRGVVEVIGWLFGVNGQ
jgi:hypothetical protein